MSAKLIWQRDKDDTAWLGYSGDFAVAVVNHAHANDKWYWQHLVRVDFAIAENSGNDVPASTAQAALTEADEAWDIFVNKLGLASKA